MSVDLDRAAFMNLMYGAEEIYANTPSELPAWTPDSDGSHQMRLRDFRFIQDTSVKEPRDSLDSLIIRPVLEVMGGPDKGRIDDGWKLRFTLERRGFTKGVLAQFLGKKKCPDSTKGLMKSLDELSNGGAAYKIGYTRNSFTPKGQEDKITFWKREILGILKSSPAPSPEKKKEVDTPASGG